MLHRYLLEESTVRESGETAVLDLKSDVNQSLLLTLGITHAVEQESVILEVFGSRDGVSWNEKPLLTVPQKFYCGSYQLVIPRNDFRYLKAGWRVNRWGRGGLLPFFRLYVLVEAGRAHMLAGAA